MGPVADAFFELTTTADGTRKVDRAALSRLYRLLAPRLHSDIADLMREVVMLALFLEHERDLMASHAVRRLGNQLDARFECLWDSVQRAREHSREESIRRARAFLALR